MNVKIESDLAFEKKYLSYPDGIREKMTYLKDLVHEAATEIEGLETIEETLKWGEPSFLTKHGSTLRMDWKEKTPNQYAMYFKCTSKLVETFKEVYGKTFTYEKNRAIVFDLTQAIPETELKQCIKATLNYHKVKHLKQLGID